MKQGDRRAETLTVVLLIAAGFFYVVLVGYQRGKFLGPDYSGRLFHTIWINLAFAIVICGYCVYRRKHPATVILTITLACIWVYMWAINSVV